LIAEQAGGGWSVAEFCRRRKLSQASFYQWRRKLRSATSPPRPNSRPAGQFVPVSLIGDVPRPVVGQGATSVQFPCGVVLRLPAGDEQALAQVVSLLLAAEESPQ
jgi:hypothetical protein